MLDFYLSSAYSPKQLIPTSDIALQLLLTNTLGFTSAAFYSKLYTAKQLE